RKNRKPLHTIPPTSIKWRAIILSPRWRSSCPTALQFLPASLRNYLFTATLPINGVFASFSTTSPTRSAPLRFALSGLREDSTRLFPATTRISARKAPRPTEFRGSITSRNFALSACPRFAFSRICRPVRGRVTASRTANLSPCALSPSSSLVTSRIISSSFAIVISKAQIYMLQSRLAILTLAVVGAFHAVSAQEQPQPSYLYKTSLVQA